MIYKRFFLSLILLFLITNIFGCCCVPFKSSINDKNSSTPNNKTNSSNLIVNLKDCTVVEGQELNSEVTWTKEEDFVIDDKSIELLEDKIENEETLIAFKSLKDSHFQKEEFVKLKEVFKKKGFTEKEIDLFINSLTKMKSPYLIRGNIYISKKLIIEAGVKIYFEDGTGLFSNKGELIAIGNETEPIIFITVTEKADPGSWYGISAVNSSLKLQNCIVSCGGQKIEKNDIQANIYCSNSAVDISNCTITNSALDGIYLEKYDDSYIKNNKITDNNGYGLNIPEYVTNNLQVEGNTIKNNTYPVKANINHFLDSLSLDNDLSENENNVITVIGGNADGVLPDLRYPYLITSSIYSNNFSIEPGVVLKFLPNTGLSGSCKAIGTASKPITFTSSLENPSPGSWYGISAVNSSLKLQNCIVSCGGQKIEKNDIQANIYCSNSAVDISNCTITNSALDGIYLEKYDDSYIKNNKITDNNGYGLNIPEYVEKNENGRINDLQVESNIIKNNTYPVKVNIKHLVKHFSSDNDLTENENNVITVNGGNIYGGILPNLGCPYIITSSIYNKNYNGLSTLTIEPGVVLKFSPNTGLFAANFDGITPDWGSASCIKAIGTASKPITFTSSLENPSPGSWYGIYIYRNDGNSRSEFEYCNISYGGQLLYIVNESYYKNKKFNLPFLIRSNLTFQEGSGIIKNCEIFSSKYNGIELALTSYGNTLIENNKIDKNDCGIKYQDAYKVNISKENDFSNNSINISCDGYPLYIIESFLSDIKVENLLSSYFYSKSRQVKKEDIYICNICAVATLTNYILLDFSNAFEIALLTGECDYIKLAIKRDVEKLKKIAIGLQNLTVPDEYKENCNNIVKGYTGVYETMNSLLPEIKQLNEENYESNKLYLEFAENVDILLNSIDELHLEERNYNDSFKASMFETFLDIPSTAQDKSFKTSIQKIFSSIALLHSKYTKKPIDDNTSVENSEVLNNDENSKEQNSVVTKDAENFFKEGLSLYDQGKYKEAIECYDNAIKINPKYADVWYKKGVAIYKYNEDMDEELYCYNKAIEANPNHAKALYAKGWILYEQTDGGSLEAKEFYKKAKELSPDDPLIIWYGEL